MIIISIFPIFSIWGDYKLTKKSKFAEKREVQMLNSGRGFINGIPPVTKNIIIINLLVWLATISLPDFLFRSYNISFDMVNILGLHYFQAEAFHPYQLVTYMFMHDTSSFSHVFFNMFSVFMFGRTVEMTWGSKKFLTFYMITGIGAGLVQQAAWAYSLMGINFSPFELNQLITIGASGAVFGILLAFGMLYPNAPLFLMFIPIPIKAKYFVIGYGLIELFYGVRQSSGDNVAHFAHLGGMLFGFILVYYWKKKDKNNGGFFQ